MKMERSLLPLPRKKKQQQQQQPPSPINKNIPMNITNTSIDKSKSLKGSPKSSESSKRGASPLDLNKSILAGSIKDQSKNKQHKNPSSSSVNVVSKSKATPQVNDVSKRICHVTSSDQHFDSPKIFIGDGEDPCPSPGFVPPRGHHGALGCPNKANRIQQDFNASRQLTLKGFSKHLPQFAKDVLNSKGSKVQPTYQKLERFKFADDLLMEDFEMNEEGENSPIYHELDPIGIQFSKHTYQSIGEIQEELSKICSTPTIPEPRSAPPTHVPTTNISCHNVASSPLTPSKVKSTTKSFFSKMWQPKKSQKSNPKECKFINSMPLLLAKDFPDGIPDEAQRSPSLVTFLGATRSQMGSISQPGSANLEKSGYASSPHTCRVFTFEDIEINDMQVFEVSRMERRISPLPLVKEFKSKSTLAKQRTSPLALDSPKSDTCPSIGCYATLMFPENSFCGSTKKGSKLIKCYEPHTKALHSAIVPPKLLTNQNKVLAYGRSSLIKEPPVERKYSTNRNLKPSNISSENGINETMEKKSSTNISGSIESLLSQDTLRSDSPVFHQSPLHRSPFSSPSCGVRMAELRANSRRSDSKSPSPEPPHGGYTSFPYHFKESSHFASRIDGASTHLIKSPPRVVCKSPNRYMHTILEEENSVEHVLCIESLEEVSTNVSLSDQPEVMFEEKNLKIDQICEDKLKTTHSNPDIKGLRSASLSSDLASLSSDLFSSEDSINCPTTDPDTSFRMIENKSGLLRRDQYYIKLPNTSSNLRENSEGSSNSVQSLDKINNQQGIQIKVIVDKTIRGSKLRPPKSSSMTPQHNNDNPVDKSTFQSGPSKSPSHDSTHSNGSIHSPSKTYMGGAESRRSHLSGPTLGLKQPPLKYSKPVSSNVSPSVTQRQQSDLVAVEIKTPSSAPTPSQGTRVLRPPKSSKNNFGYLIKDQTINSSVNSPTFRNCQTIPAPTQGSGFDSLPKSETTIIHQGQRYRAPTMAPMPICDLNSSLSSSPTSSSSSMFSTIESENEALLLTLRKDMGMPCEGGRFKLSKESSSQSLDSRTTSSLNSNSGSETSKGSDKSRLLAPRTDVSKCLEKYNKVLSTTQDSNLSPSTSRLKTPRTVSTDC